MEPLSIAASFIAMGQAIAAIPKIIAILRSATELGYELAGLLNELATLQAIQLSVEDSITALSGADHLYQLGRPETQLLLRTRNDLTDLVNGLQTLAERCSRKLGEHGLPRPNHLKLLWKSKDITRLRERARTICIHINLALSQISLVSQVTILGIGASLHIKVPRVIPLKNSEAWSAAYGGNSTALKHWLSTLRYSPFDVQSDGASLVLHAIRGGRGSTVEFLVDFWDIGKGTKCDDLTVYYATLALEAAGTDQARTKDQYTRSLCLIAASREGYNENITEPTLHQLVRDGLDISHHAMPWAINSYDTWQRTPLVIACQVGNLEAARMLIMRGASVDLPDLLGRTPLMWAVKHREHHTSSALAELLLDAGCNADVKDRFGHPAIGIAMQGSFPNGYSPCLRRLVKQTDVRALNKPPDDPFRQNPLHWFACTASRSDPGTREILALLLSAGARLDMPDVRGHIPLQRAIMRNNTVGFDLLRSAYEQTNAELYDGHAILCTAATNAGAEILRGLMDSCLMDTVDIDSLDERGEDPVSIFRRRATVPEDMMAGLSRPTAEETMAFESLVQNIRCRILKERIGPSSS
ncbi:hypothetical protein ETB97_010398 [Aspergillus alliaceus]|uniref:Ankyrin repeat protein n=1 Tax=Petromyces alliaceus TaxID=209559 RepID=A0A8H6A7J7_PETAA|nr:hypothetical protein ETB97_010398 [Aspergillus burnettii]